MKLFIYCFREFDEKKIFDKLCKESNVDYEYTPDYPTLQNAHLARGSDAISITPSSMNEILLKKFKQMGISAILNRSIGIDHIDLQASENLNIQIYHSSYPPQSVADYAIMMMMMSLRKINIILETTKLQDFTLNGKIGKSLSNCTVGIIGTGQIGKTVIQRLNGFGCNILAYDPYINEEIKNLCEYTTLEKIYEQSDVISLHIPANSENHHLINYKSFKKMKNTAILVNTARGSLIDTDALIEALEQNQIGGVALDVLENEEGLYYIDHRGENIFNRELGILQSFPRVIITPHTAFYTEEVVDNIAKDTIDCFLKFMRGKSII